MQEYIKLTLLSDDPISLSSETALRGEKGDVFVPFVDSDLTSENYGQLTWDLKASSQTPNQIEPVNLLAPFQRKTPCLTDAQKVEIRMLMDDYRLAKSLWVYDGTFRRESYAYPVVIDSLDNAGIEGCMYNGKYIINCGLLCQMLWMGRALSDFDIDQPTTDITQAFDWGYYFDFVGAKRAFGVMKNDTEYYGANTYETKNGNTIFTTFDNAASMAQELYKKGCEIPYSEADVGDLIFYRSGSISDGDDDELEQTSFRYITHVGIVYDKNEDGPIVLESSSAWAAAVGRFGYDDALGTFANVRAADQEVRVCMVARHPAAYGVPCNVPDRFEVYRGTAAV